MDRRMTTDVEALANALTSYKQADEDGVMVLVSRQACDEAATTLRTIAGERDEARAEAKHWYGQIEQVLDPSYLDQKLKQIGAVRDKALVALAGVCDDAMRADNDLCAMEARAEAAEAERDGLAAAVKAFRETEVEENATLRADRDRLSARVGELEKVLAREIYIAHHQDFSLVGLQPQDDGTQVCIGTDTKKLAAARRLRDLGFVTIKDHPAGPMVSWSRDFLATQKDKTDG